MYNISHASTLRRLIDAALSKEISKQDLARLKKLQEYLNDVYLPKRGFGQEYDNFINSTTNNAIARQAQAISSLGEASLASALSKLVDAFKNYNLERKKNIPLGRNWGSKDKDKAQQAKLEYESKTNEREKAMQKYAKEFEKNKSIAIKLISKLLSK